MGKYKKRDKNEIIELLYKYQENLGRPLVRTDITSEKIGFSTIVINRIWGTWGKCKAELNLLPSPTFKPKPFEYYKSYLDNILKNIYIDTGRKWVSWKDIENPKYSDSKRPEHKTFKKAFERQGVDIFLYIKSKGFIMNPSNFSFHYTFNDGERVLSTLEYDFSTFLKEEGYIYNIDYKRDVRYKDFLLYNQKSRINCDYVIGNKYIEIAGIIWRQNDLWETYSYSSKQENEYRDKLKLKKKLLEDNHCDYLFLFEDDFINGTYINRFEEFMNCVKEDEYA